MDLELRRSGDIGWVVLLGIVLLSLLIIPEPSFVFSAGKIESFSADQVFLSPDGKKAHTTKLYVTPTAYRMDGMPGGMGQGQPETNLTFLGFRKEKKQYIYNHDKKIYFQTELDEETMSAELKSYQNVDSEKILGKEKISGYPCIKKEVTTTITIMGMKSTSTAIIWQSDQFEFPLRAREEDGSITEFRNIKTKKPSKKLFKRPTGYKKVDNMMEVMGLDMQAMMDRQKEPVKQAGKPSENGGQNVNMEDIMAGIKQAMGNSMEDDQKGQLQEIMAKAMSRAQQTKTDGGAAAGLWDIIPRRPSDTIGSEMKAPQIYQVIMGSNSSLKEVFSFYEKKLSSDGWKDGGTFIQNGKGFLNMSKQDMSLMVSWAENPGMEGNFNLFYTLQLQGPNL